jgi:hypothetical protein
VSNVLAAGTLFSVSLNTTRITGVFNRCQYRPRQEWPSAKRLSGKPHAENSYKYVQSTNCDALYECSIKASAEPGCDSSESIFEKTGLGRDASSLPGTSNDDLDAWLRASQVMVKIRLLSETAVLCLEPFSE